MNFKILITVFIVSFISFAYSNTNYVNNSPKATPDSEHGITNNKKTFKVVKTESEWKKILSNEAYHVLREKGTEAPFTGKYHNYHEKGTYYCAACNLHLFSSKHKFDSGTGWPSFYQPIEKNNVLSETDTSYGMERTEVVCSRCGGHLGHVFNDGPKPTGLRYCINSVSIIFKK